LTYGSGVKNKKPAHRNSTAREAPGSKHTGWVLSQKHHTKQEYILSELILILILAQAVTHSGLNRYLSPLIDISIIGGHKTTLAPLPRAEQTF
jgi:hypothetical protein